MQQSLSNVLYELAFTQREARVGLLLQRKERAENKRLFDLLAAQQGEIEAAYGDSLAWLRKDDLIQCQIVHSVPFDGFNREEWPAMARWMSHQIIKFEAAIREPLALVAGSLSADQAENT